MPRAKKAVEGASVAPGEPGSQPTAPGEPPASVWACVDPDLREVTIDGATYQAANGWLACPPHVAERLARLNIVRV